MLVDPTFACECREACQRQRAEALGLGRGACRLGIARGCGSADLARERSVHARRHFVPRGVEDFSDPVEPDLSGRSVVSPGEDALRRAHGLLDGIEVDGVSHDVAKRPVGRVVDETVARGLNLQVAVGSQTPLVPGHDPFPARVDVHHAVHARQRRKVVQTAVDLEFRRQEFRARQPVTVVDLHPQPVRIGTVVG